MINVVELKKQLEAVNEEVHVDIKEHSAITMFKDRNGVEIEEQLSQALSRWLSICEYSRCD